MPESKAHPDQCGTWVTFGKEALRCERKPPHRYHGLIHTDRSQCVEVRWVTLKGKPMRIPAQAVLP